MLFNKTIEPRCAYCQRGTSLEEGVILCIKRGVVEPTHACRSFRYDPLKRTPAEMVPPNFSKLNDEDFSL